MTIFAGAFATDPARALPVHLCQQLEHATARSNVPIPRRTFVGERHFVAVADIGAFVDDPIAHADARIGVLIGDALITAHSGRLPRREQAEMLLNESTMPSDAAFLRARGTYAFAAIDPIRHQLTLVTDHLGVRPVYYSFRDGLLIFASALRIFDDLDGFPLTPSRQGRAEVACFGYPLEERTVYLEVNRLRPAERLTASATGLTTETYFDWSAVPASASTPMHEISPECIRAVYRAFREAVSLRLPDDRVAFAFLSGGLDSRAIVTSLVDEGIDVQALNFSPPGSQDEQYAQLFAKSLSDRCNLHCFGLTEGTQPRWSSMAAKALTTIRSAPTVPTQGPALVWAGDGGSVGLGHVYLTEEMVNSAATGGVSDAAHVLLAGNRWQLPWSIFRADAAQRIRDDILAAVQRELRRYERRGSDRALYLFLMCNDQHRHLDTHFEDIDLHQVELLLPFFDAEFVKTVTSLPLSACLYHRAYASVFEQFPKVARSTPWQTYPGHVPCPVPSPSGDPATYQWSSKTRSADPRDNDHRDRARELLRFTLTPNFDDTLFHPSRVRIAAALYWLGIRNFDYMTRIVGLLTDQVRGAPGAERE